jgi:hypothetical protein
MSMGLTSEFRTKEGYFRSPAAGMIVERTVELRWTVAVNRIELRQLAEDRVLDAEALLNAARWSGAYYLAGYAVECGLKACVLAFVERTGQIFRDKDFSRKCFTHKLIELIDLADLRGAHNDLLKSNSAFSRFWADVDEWTEASRYQQKTESETRLLCVAITSDPDGVLSWIRTKW